MDAAVDMVAAAVAAPPAAALEASMSAALEVPVASAVAALVSVFAALVSAYIADAHFLDAASAAVVVAAVVVGAAELAGYGHPGGAGSTPAGPNLHLRVKKLASRLMRPVTRPLARRRRRVHAIATRRHLPSPQKVEALGKSRS